MALPRLFFSRHALARMLERGLDVDDVRSALQAGEAIEEYEDSSKPVLGWSGVRALHLVVKEAEPADTFVITVYEPDPRRWDASLRRRLDYQ